jgi:hypothetical protein
MDVKSIIKLIAVDTKRDVSTANIRRTAMGSRLGSFTIIHYMTQMTFGKMKFGKMTFGKLTFGKMTWNIQRFGKIMFW